MNCDNKILNTRGGVILKEIAQKIEEEMKKQNLNKAEIARRLGVSRANVNMIMKKIKNGGDVSTKTLTNISKVLGKEIEFFLK